MNWPSIDDRDHIAREIECPDPECQTSRLRSAAHIGLAAIATIGFVDFLWRLLEAIN